MGEVPNTPGKVDYEVDGRVAVITLDSPDARNAVTAPMHDSYRERLAESEADVDVGAIVVTGAGDSFCAGADLAAVNRVAQSHELGTTSGSPTSRPGYGVHPAFDRPWLYQFGLTKPVIAAVNGPAVGLGFVIACVADVRLAAARATMRLGFARLGLPAEYGLSWILPRLIGASRATELMLSDRTIDAREAQEVGLVTRVHADEELRDASVRYAHELAERCSPSSLRETKRQIYTDLLRDLGASFDDSRALVERMIAESDFQEGVSALREGRRPNFPRPSASK